MANRKWTEREEKLLEMQFTNGYKYSIISKNLHRTKESVRAKCKELRMYRFRIKIKKWRNEETQKLKTLYDKGYTLKQISRQLNRSRDSVRYKLREKKYERNFEESIKFHEKMSIKKLKKDFRILTAEKAYILGVLCGDGCFYKNHKTNVSSVILGVKDKDFADKFDDSFQKIYGIKLYRGRQNNIFVASTNRKIVCRDISQYGSFGSQIWKIPEKIIDSEDKQIIIKFLQGFSDSESHVNPSGSDIAVYSSNKCSLYQVLILFRKLGIWATMTKTRDNDKIWQINISGKLNLRKFDTVIGFNIKRKKERIEKYINNITTGKKTYSEKDYYDAMKLLGRYNISSTSKTSGIPYSTLRNWKSQKYPVSVRKKLLIQGETM